MNRFFKRLFLTIVLLELFLGGGGRLVDSGAISLRMYLFVISLILAMLAFSIKPKISISLILLLCFGTVCICLGFLVGILGETPRSLVLEDVRPLLSFYSILFFYTFIQSEDDIFLIVKLLRVSAIILAIGYLIIFAGIHTGRIPFLQFYAWTEPTKEFFFRGQYAFFYKGFFYLCVGLFFFKWNANAHSKAVMIIIIVAILLTFTRGFILSFFLVYLFYFLFIKKKVWILAVFLFLSIFLAPFIWKFISKDDVLNRAVSDSERIIQIREVFEGVTPVSALIGHGFGNTIPSREDLHLEISYLEIFHKLGIIGLLFWATYLWMIYRNFVASARNGHQLLAVPFFLSCIFAYLLSGTNPFINNPIGLNMLAISFCVMLRLKALGAKQIIDHTAKNTIYTNERS